MTIIGAYGIPPRRTGRRLRNAARTSSASSSVGGEYMPCARIERPSCPPGRTLKVICSAASPRRRWVLAGTAWGCALLLCLDSTTFCTASAKSPGLNCCAETKGDGKGKSSRATVHPADQPFGTPIYTADYALNVLLTPSLITNLWHAFASNTFVKRSASATTNGVLRQ